MELFYGCAFKCFNNSDNDQYFIEHKTDCEINILDLPNELILNIFSNLDFNDLKNSRLSCKSWKKISKIVIDQKKIIHLLINEVPDNYANVKKQLLDITLNINNDNFEFAKILKNLEIIDLEHLSQLPLINDVISLSMCMKLIENPDLVQSVIWQSSQHPLLKVSPIDKEDLTIRCRSIAIKNARINTIWENIFNYLLNKKMFDLAEKASCNLPDSMYLYKSNELIVELVKNEKIEAAERIVSKMNDKDMDSGFVSICDALSEIGKISEVWNFADQITFFPSKSEVIKKTFSLLVKNGDIETAIDFTLKRDDYLVYCLSCKLIDDKDYLKAEEVADLITDREFKEKAFHAISNAFIYKFISENELHYLENVLYYLETKITDSNLVNDLYLKIKCFTERLENCKDIFDKIHKIYSSCCKPEDLESDSDSSYSSSDFADSDSNL